MILCILCVAVARNKPVTSRIWWKCVFTLTVYINLLWLLLPYFILALGLGNLEQVIYTCVPFYIILYFLYVDILSIQSFQAFQIHLPIAFKRKFKNDHSKHGQSVPLRSPQRQDKFHCGERILPCLGLHPPTPIWKSSAGNGDKVTASDCD